jgi:hypothetical protein
VAFLNNRDELVFTDRIEPKYVKPLQLQNTFYESFKMGIYQSFEPFTGKDTTGKKQEIFSPVVKKHFTTVRISESAKSGGTKEFPPIGTRPAILYIVRS